MRGRAGWWGLLGVSAIVVLWLAAAATDARDCACARAADTVIPALAALPLSLPKPVVLLLRGLARGAFIALLAYAGIAIYMAAFQAKYIYFPTHAIAATPADVGLPFEELWLDTPDGGRVNAWYIPAPREARGTVLVCHGNGGNICHRLDTIEVFRSLGFDVLIFDYRGYGKSSGTPSERRTYEDAEAALQYLTQERGIPEERLVVFGRSLGGAVAAHLAAQHHPALLIVESSFTSVVDMARTVYPYLPVGLLTRYRYPTREHIRQATCPVIVAHSRTDELISFSHGEALYAAATEPKTFIELQGTHNLTLEASAGFYAERLGDAIGQFYAPQITGPPTGSR